VQAGDQFACYGEVDESLVETGVPQFFSLGVRCGEPSDAGIPASSTVAGGANGANAKAKVREHAETGENRTLSVAYSGSVFSAETGSRLRRLLRFFLWEALRFISYSRGFKGIAGSRRQLEDGCKSLRASARRLRRGEWSAVC
jgi:hypothetical protein